MNEVQYRDIEGYPGYRVGDDGSVWSRKDHGGGLKTDWRQLKPIRTRTGYLRVHLCGGGGKKLLLVHRLVLTSFIGHPPDGHVGCHNDGDPENNSLTNLKWDTRKANEADKIRHGTHNRGERHNMAKLTAEQVAEIRAKYAEGGITQAELGAQYGVRQDNISDIVRWESWKHAITQPEIQMHAQEADPD